MKTKRPLKLRPSDIRFTQDSISEKFKDGGLCHTLYDDIKNGTKIVEDVPQIRVALEGGKYYSSNNRRLYVFRALEYDGKIESISVREISYSRLCQYHGITTNNDGVSIKTRGPTRSLPHSIEEIKNAVRKRNEELQRKSVYTVPARHFENCHSRSGEARVPLSEQRHVRTLQPSVSSTKPVLPSRESNVRYSDRSSPVVVKKVDTANVTKQPMRHAEWSHSIPKSFPHSVRHDNDSKTKTSPLKTNRAHELGNHLLYSPSYPDYNTWEKQNFLRRISPEPSSGNASKKDRSGNMWTLICVGATALVGYYLYSKVRKSVGDPTAILEECPFQAPQSQRFFEKLWQACSKPFSTPKHCYSAVSAMEGLLLNGDDKMHMFW